jgi:hypothetical protein
VVQQLSALLLLRILRSRRPISTWDQLNYQHTIRGSHSGGYEDITLCSQLQINRRFRRTRCSRLCLLPSCLVYSTTMKMEATYSSEILFDFQWITRLYVRKDRTLKLLDFSLPIPFNLSSINVRIIL